MDGEDSDEPLLLRRRLRFFYLTAKRNFKNFRLTREVKIFFAVLLASEVCGVVAAVCWINAAKSFCFPGGKYAVVASALLASYYATTIFYPLWFAQGFYFHGRPFYKIGLADTGFFSVAGKCYEWVLHGLEQALGAFFLVYFDSVPAATVCAAVTQIPIYIFLSVVICAPWLSFRARLFKSAS